jgi:hypothetical protein
MVEKIDHLWDLILYTKKVPDDRLAEYREYVPRKLFLIAQQRYSLITFFLFFRSFSSLFYSGTGRRSFQHRGGH